MDNTSLSPGKGHYTYGTTAQMITCLYVVLFYSAMTTIPSGNNALIHKYHGDDADNILNALKSSSVGVSGSLTIDPSSY